MKNQDEECFKWCVARHFCRDERNPQRISKRLRLEVDKLNWKGIEFPMKLSKINSFEKLNNISINVYSLDNELNLYPLRISEETFEVCIHLLLIQEKEKRHYILMKDLSPFIKHDSKVKKYVCLRCLSTFNKQEKLDSHLNDCKAKKPTRVTFSDKEKLEFTNTERQIKHAFVIYADFESTLEKIQTCEANPMSSYTQRVQKHTANSFCV